MKRGASFLSMVLCLGMAWPAIAADRPLIVELWPGKPPEEAAELHVYATAAHDFAVRSSKHPCSTWTQSCAHWLRHQGFLKRTNP
jgi:hypothetical protein